MRRRTAFKNSDLPFAPSPRRLTTSCPGGGFTQTRSLGLHRAACRSESFQPTCRDETKGELGFKKSHVLTDSLGEAQKKKKTPVGAKKTLAAAI